MPNNYIVKLKNNKLSCFYYKNNIILFKLYENNKWSKEQSLLSDIKDDFTICLDKKGFIYLFCQNINGDLILCTNRERNWTNSVILKSLPSNNNRILMHSIINETTMHLIYNTPLKLKEDKGNNLIFQNLNQFGILSPSLHIDKFYNTPELMYELQMVTYDHGVLFYQTRTTENILGYREITPQRFGTYYPFHKTGFQILDTSYLTTYSSIHVLYIVKSIFSTHLIYKKKEETEFSQPITLYDAPRINNCLLFIVNNKLYASFINNGNLYICISEDKGNTFSKPTRYENKICVNPVKANFISQEVQQEDDYLIRQMYVDKLTPWDIQVLPNIYSQFYPISNIMNDTEDELKTSDVRHSNDNLHNNFENLENITNLKSIIKAKTSEILEKDNQINYMTDIMKKKLENFKQVEEDYKLSIQKLEHKNKGLLNEIQNLKKNYEDLVYKNNTDKKVELSLIENIKPTDAQNKTIT